MSNKNFKSVNEKMHVIMFHVAKKKQTVSLQSDIIKMELYMNHILFYYFSMFINCKIHFCLVIDLVNYLRFMEEKKLLMYLLKNYLLFKKFFYVKKKSLLVNVL